MSSVWKCLILRHNVSSLKIHSKIITFYKVLQFCLIKQETSIKCIIYLDSHIEASFHVYIDRTKKKYYTTIYHQSYNCSNTLVLILITLSKLYTAVLYSFKFLKQNTRYSTHRYTFKDSLQLLLCANIMFKVLSLNDNGSSDPNI